MVEFSENAIITEGGNQISSNYLIYNIAEQRINAQSAGDDGDRVKIKYTPKTLEQEEAANTTADEEVITDSAAADEDASTQDGDDDL